MTHGARKVWESVYPKLSTGHSGLLGSVTARAEAQVIRLALAYALANGCEQIEEAHLFAGVAIWEYAEASARHIFGSALGDPVADDLYRALRASPTGVSRTDMYGICGRHTKGERIGAALQLLERSGKARCEMRPSDGGRPAETWVAI